LEGLSSEASHPLPDLNEVHIAPSLDNGVAIAHHVTIASDGDVFLDMLDEITAYEVAAAGVDITGDNRAACGLYTLGLFWILRLIH